MNLTDEDKAWFLDAIGKAAQSTERQLGERFDALERRFSTLDERFSALEARVVGLEADMALALDKLERLDSIEREVRDTRLKVAQLSREFMRDHRKVEADTERLAKVEKRVTELELRLQQQGL